VPEIAGGLPAQVGTTLRGIPPAGLAVANRALLGRRATPFDGRGVRLIAVGWRAWPVK